MSSVLAKVTMRAVLNGNKVKQTQTEQGTIIDRHETNDMI